MCVRPNPKHYGWLRRNPMLLGLTDVEALQFEQDPKKWVGDDYESDDESDETEDEDDHEGGHCDETDVKAGNADDSDDEH